MIGFEKGLQQWKKFIKPDGYLVATEVVWTRDEEAGAILDSFDREIEVYKNYKDYFEYMFYILQKKEELYIRSICGIRRKIE
ncbi:MAG: hypothetical protein ISS19_15555 [Bacteroidales bacterium]|nr:hypothetical protein [Bacteroidales bacterium]